MDFYQCINNTSLLNHSTLSELRQLVEEFPFFQSARLLYLYNLYVVRDSSFTEEVQHSSVMLSDRQALFQMIEGANYDVVRDSLQRKQRPIVTEDEDRTISLIDSFLSVRPVSDDAGASTQPHAVPTVTEATSDYASFLAQQHDEGQDVALTHPVGTSQPAQLKGIHLIDNFIEETKGKQRYEIPVADESLESLPATGSPADDEADNDLYNPNIVNILIKQGSYEQALEILRKICLNNPEKNATFASQMQLLEVIVQGKIKENK